MTPQNLASKLTVWSKRKISYTEALEHAHKYFNGAIGEGLIKEYFKSVCPIEIVQQLCKIPACSNLTKGIYCDNCTSMLPNSAVTGLIKALGEFLCSRQL